MLFHNRLGWILIRCPPRTERYGDNGNQEDNTHRQGIYPPRHLHAIDILLHPAIDDVVADGYCHCRADSHNIEVLAVEEAEYLAYRCSVYSANTNLSAAILRLEEHQAKDSDNRNHNREELEHRNKGRELVLTLVNELQFVAEELNLNLLWIAIRRDIQDGLLDKLSYIGNISSRNSADIGNTR